MTLSGVIKFRSRSCWLPFYLIHVKCRAQVIGPASAEHLSGVESLSTLSAQERNDFKPNSLETCTGGHFFTQLSGAARKVTG